MSGFFRTAFRNTGAEILSLLFFIFFGWWAILHLTPGVSSDALQLWGATYQIIAWYGAIAGLFISHRWGGYKSLVGRAILSFSLGLFFQCFAQTTYSAYVYFFQIPIPYPSIGDIGFFGSIPFYAYGAYMLARISGARVSLRSYKNQALAILLPVAMLALSGFIFLRGYQFDWSQPIKIFLDFGYPLGQAFYVSIAILAYLLSRKVLGGMMRLPILCFIIALVAEYCADFYFLVQANAGTYYSGGSDDMVYVIAYTAMVFALFYTDSIHKVIQTSYPQEIASTIGAVATTIFNQIVVKIIKEQELVIGPLAWSEAGKVSGLQVVDRKNGQVELKNGDPKDVVNRLVAQYERLFGKASHEVCKEAAAGLIKGLSPAEIPSSLLV